MDKELEISQEIIKFYLESINNQAHPTGKVSHQYNEVRAKLSPDDYLEKLQCILAAQRTLNELKEATEAKEKA